MARTYAKDLDDYSPPQVVDIEFGLMMAFVGLLGIFWPTFLGLNLGSMHSFILISTGAIAVWSALTPNTRRTFYINLGLGFFYTLNVVAGILVGKKGMAQFDFYSPEQLNRFAPGFLELSIGDHVVHALIALVFFSEAYSWKRLIEDRPPVSKQSKEFYLGILKITAIILLFSLIFTVVFQIQSA